MNTLYIIELIIAVIAGIIIPIYSNKIKSKGRYAKDNRESITINANNDNHIDINSNNRIYNFNVNNVHVDAVVDDIAKDKHSTPFLMYVIVLVAVMSFYYCFKPIILFSMLSGMIMTMFFPKGNIKSYFKDKSNILCLLLFAITMIFHLLSIEHEAVIDIHYVALAFSALFWLMFFVMVYFKKILLHGIVSSKKMGFLLTKNGNRLMKLLPFIAVFFILFIR